MALHSGEVPLETTRGRGVGDGAVELVDLPWEAVVGFVSTGSLRGAALRDAHVVAFHNTNGESGGLRPVKAGVQALADAWILEGLDDEAAQDYVTGEELSSTEGRRRSSPPSATSGRVGSSCSYPPDCGGPIVGFESPAEGGPFVCPERCSTSIEFVGSRLVEASDVSWKSTSQGGSRGKTSRKSAKHRQRLGRGFCKFGERSRGARGSPQPVGGIETGGLRPGSSVVGSAASAEPSTSGETSWPKASGPCSRGVSWWGRFDEFKFGGEGLLGERCLYQSNERFAESGQSHQSSGVEGTGNGRRSRRRQCSPPIHGTESSIARSSSSGLFCCNAGRMLVSGVSVPERGTTRDDCQDVLLRGAVCNRRGKMPASLASDRIPGTFVPLTDQSKTADGIAAVRSPVLTCMGSGEHLLPQGPRLHGDSDAEPWETHQATAHGGQFGCCERSSTQEATKRSRQEEQGHHRGGCIDDSGRGIRSHFYADAPKGSALDDEHFRLGGFGSDNPDNPSIDYKGCRLPKLKPGPDKLDPLELVLQFCSLVLPSQPLLEPVLLSPAPATCKRGTETLYGLSRSLGSDGRHISV